MNQEQYNPDREPERDEVSEEDIYYEIPDDEEEALNEGEEEEEEPGKKPEKASPLIMTVKLMLRPVQGWKNLKQSRYTPPEYAWQCFYPLTALAAVGQFANLIYSPDITLREVLIEMVVIFMALLIGNYGTLSLLDIIMKAPLRKRFRNDFSKVFVMAVTSTLSIAIFLWELIPLLSPIFVFLPIYSIYLIVRGVKFIRIPKERQTRVISTLSILIIGIPLLLYIFFNDILPLQ